MTQAQYARHRGQSREAVRKAVRDGKIPLDAQGRIDPRKADRAWLANSAGRSHTRGPDAQLNAATAYRAASEARKAYWAAEREEMLARREAGDLVQIDEVRQAEAEVAREITNLLQGIRKRISSTLAAMDEADAIDHLLEEEHRHACSALSQMAGGAPVLPSSPEAASAQATFPGAPPPGAAPPSPPPAPRGRFGR